MSRRTRTWGMLCVLMLIVPATRAAEPQPPPAVPKSADATPLAGTMPLTMEGDIASAMVEGIDRFLLREIEKSPQARMEAWRELKVSDARRRLRQILGIKDVRVPFTAPDLIATVGGSSVIAKGKGYEVHAIRWPAFGQVHGEGLLVLPTEAAPTRSIIVVPDSSQTPEQLLGLVEGVPADLQYGRIAANAGYRVVVPTIINREFDKRPGLTNREFIYRSAFELGRHLIGYELLKIFAIADWLDHRDIPTHIIGWGDGGMYALYAAALETGSIQAACASGYVDDRRGIWRQPIDRNVFGLLNAYGDAELAMMAMDVRHNGRVTLDPTPGPTLTLKRGPTGAPAELLPADQSVVMKEASRTESIGAAAFGIDLSPGVSSWFTEEVHKAGSPEVVGNLPDAKVRHARQLDELDRHNQQLLAESLEVRKKFMAGLDTSSLEKHAATVENYRKTFYEQVIGKFDQPLSPANPRTRKVYDAPKWTGYEVLLDVFPDVFAYGLLLLPKDLKEGEKRPVVVTQHGLEGRPQDTIGPDGWKSYKAFSAQLADRGFIVFSPQNPYIFRDRFRTLQRKANPLGKTLFSIIVPQHQQIVNWLKTHPNVDEKRIAFYGLSYGGKTAMRVPAIVTDYCLSICSADFNEWIWKNASSKSPYSYVWTGEYEIFEFDLGGTFNYSDMAALIAPRPFMVERGHFDNVAPDETVAYEYAKVRNLYAARLGIGDRTEIEWFVGPHTINGQGTFDFLHKHLNWPKPQK